MNALWFVLAAVALLGSPGPGIAALVAAGRADGVVRGLAVYAGMQLGLAILAGLSVLGLSAVLLALPALRFVAAIVAVAYLAWLAWRTASAPVGEGAIGGGRGGPATFAGGFLLGFANLKACLAFASLFASFTLIPTHREGDAAAKWLICVAVMATVDFAWLATGAAVGQVRLGPTRERLLNVAMGAMILLAALCGMR